MNMSPKLAIHGGDAVITDGTIAPWPQILPEDREAVMRVLDRGVLWGPTAPETVAMEREWAAYVGAEHCIATNSGTAALHMAVAAVGVEPGDEVITTPYSWTSTATCILHHNAIPVFADIDPTNYNIDPAKVEEKITDRTRAILVVHLYGLPVDMDAIMMIANRHGLPVIEDCCQAHGAEYKGRQVGSMGAAAAFSLNGNKNLAAGEGGLLVTQDEHIWQEAARIQQFGEKRTKDGARQYDAYGMGWMYRGTEMTAAFARSQISRYDQTLETIRQNAASLTEQLRGIPGLTVPNEPTGSKHCYYRYTLRFELEQLGLNGPPSRHVPRIRQALEAEGLAVGRAEFVIPGMTLFRQQRGYGKGCPWTCGHTTATYSYKEDDYPVAVDSRDRSMQLSGFTPPNGQKLMDLYGTGIQKVMSNLEELLTR